MMAPWIYLLVCLIVAVSGVFALAVCKQSLLCCGWLVMQGNAAKTEIVPL